MQINATNLITDNNSPFRQVAGNLENQKTPVHQAGAPSENEPEHKMKAENLEKLKSTLAENNISLQFSQDDETKEMIVKLVNQKTGEAIRQIPSEVSLRLAAASVRLQGQFVDQKD